ncbi:MAG TPA: SGNH/GDSL hydrolase family protein [Rhodocyclaceae bacterium]|nr:SGNH/GDSL hydrolase family protein [Rhodocyclaceae bacterium]HNH36207.1 SGNH/GDSL hydrolase family protein [Rhodocyclaceae bacterium]
MGIKILATVAACAVIGATPASAASYSGLFVFGDSLSDPGNLYSLTGGGLPPFPYWNGRFSNGPVAAEYMAAAMGIPALNVAVAGAMTGPNPAGSNDNYLVTKYGLTSLNGTGILGQSQFVAGLGALPDSALYMVWGGPNDVFDGMAKGSDLAGVTMPTAVANVVETVKTLYTGGARHFFVPLMPDLGLTPDTRAMGAAAMAGASDLTNGYNLALMGTLAWLDNNYMPDGDIKFFDTAKFLRDAVAGSDFANVSDACIDNLACVLDGVNGGPALGYLFWDGVHPTTRAHMQLGLAFAAAVPEPETYGMFLAGLGVLGAVVRRRRLAA